MKKLNKTLKQYIAILILLFFCNLSIADPFEKLPDHLVKDITSFLDVPEQYNLSLASKSLNKRINPFLMGRITVHLNNDNLLLFIKRFQSNTYRNMIDITFKGKPEILLNFLEGINAHLDHWDNIILDISNEIHADAHTKTLITSKYMKNVVSLLLKDNRDCYLIKYLIESKYLDNLKHLDLSNSNISFTKQIDLMPQCTACSNLYSLNLSNNNLIPEDTKNITQMLFPYLTYLDISFNNITDAGLDNIIKALPNIERLNLQTTQISDVSIEVLNNISHPTSITSLNLANNHITDKGIQALSNGTLKYLTHLNLDGCGITPQGVEYLSDSENFQSLQVLDLSNIFRIKDQGAIYLSNSKAFPSLTDLKLYRVGITEKGVLALSQAMHLSNIVVLDLGANTLGDSGITVLAQSTAFPKLKILKLKMNGISEVGIEKFAQSMNFSSLSSLDLSYNRLGEKGAYFLSLSQEFQKLNSLNLNYNNIQDEGAISFFKTVFFPSLRELFLLGNWLTEESIKTISLSALLLQIDKIDIDLSYSLTEKDQNKLLISKLLKQPRI